MILLALELCFTFSQHHWQLPLVLYFDSEITLARRTPPPPPPNHQTASENITKLTEYVIHIHTTDHHRQNLLSHQSLTVLIVFGFFSEDRLKLHTPQRLI
jgi:hypothetical protein